MNKFVAFLILGTVVAAGCVTPSAHAQTTLSPSASTPAGRVYEMRTYTTHPDRLDALQQRFRNHTTRIFEKHGMASIGYWIPQDEERARNTLVYIIAHADRETARQNWREFVADPEWQRVQAESEADGAIILRIESVFLDPTDFSPIR